MRFYGCEFYYLKLCIKQNALITGPINNSHTNNWKYFLSNFENVKKTNTLYGLVNINFYIHIMKLIGILISNGKSSFSKSLNTITRIESS
jgi:hypothetical protein